MSKAYFTDTLRSVKRTVSRFISIIVIVALGSSLFVGLNAVCPDMIETADTYYKENNLMDLRLQTYIGLYDDDLNKIRALEGVKAVQGAKFVDGFVQTPNDDDEFEGIIDIDGSELTVRLIGFNPKMADAFDNGVNDENYINRLDLVEGRYPQNEHECLVTSSSLSTPEQFVIGNKIKVVGDGEEISYYLDNNEFEIVGVVLSPAWVSYERGATTTGSGKLGDFVYIPNDAFSDKITYYSEAYVTLFGSEDYEAYSDEYDKFVDGMREKILAASEEIVKNRAAVLDIGLADRLIKAKSDLATAEKTVNLKLDDARAQLNDLKELQKNGAKQLTEAQNELEEKYAAAQEQLKGGSDQYLAAVNEYNAKATAWSNSNVEYLQKKAEYDKNKIAADTAKEQLDETNTDLKLANLKIASTETLINSTNSTLKKLSENQNVAQSDLDLDAMANRLQETNPELAQILRSASDLTAQGMAADAISETEVLLDQYQSELVIAKNTRDRGQAEYDLKYSQWSAANKELENANIQLTEAKKKLDDAESQLNSFKEQIEESGYDIQFGSLSAQTQYMTAQAELALKTTQFQNIKATVAAAEKTFAEKEAEANEQIGVAKTTYDKGVTLYNNIHNSPFWYVYTRDDSPGYTGYGQASVNMQRVAYIFPTFFYLVSTLICLTTMTRMVEEERTLLGTMKALGYDNRTIASKYILYASLASIIGTALGVGIGFLVFPKAIYAAWGIMYELPSIIINYIPLYIFFGIIISVGTTVLAAYLACRTELAAVPAELMRPKPPKAGKRVWLENIKFIWKRLSFTSKVTVRNLFRNKKRFLVTVIGIAGCTGLILASLGLQNSISSIIENQYGEKGIANYDLQVVLENAQENYNDSKAVSDINAFKEIKTSMLGYLKVCTGYSDRTDKRMEVDILVPESPGTVQEFININSDGEDIPLTDDGAVITKKFAAKTDTKVGDTISLTWTEGTKQVVYSVKVAGIADNYTFHYVYMTPACYQNMTETAATYNYLFCDVEDDISADTKTALEANINAMDGIAGTVYTSVVINNFANIIFSLNLVTMVLIAVAMVLAIVVLYNLNNINVNERIKELATLKVLGFYDGEVSAYIYRENVFLTLVGIVVGLVLGIFLNLALVGIVDIDTVTLSTSIKPISFVFAALFTLIFAVIVNFSMHFKLKKISMVESMKSVE